jgi:hypothetical protein
MDQGQNRCTGFKRLPVGLFVSRLLLLFSVRLNSSTGETEVPENASSSMSSNRDPKSNMAD